MSDVFQAEVSVDFSEWKSPFDWIRRTQATNCASQKSVRSRFRNGPIILLLISFGFSVVSIARADEGLDDYNVAVSLYKQSRWKQAAGEFRKFVNTYAKHEKAPLARLYLGLTLIELSDLQEARDELRKFVEDNPKNANVSQARYRIGECSYLLDDFPNARIELDRFVRDYSKDGMCEFALPYLGDTLLRLKDAATSLTMFDRAIEQFPAGKLVEDAKLGRARALESMKRFDDAVKQYQELAGQKDGLRAADAQFHLGAIFFERKQFPEAITAYKSLAKDFPQSSLVPAAQLNAGHAFYQSGKYEEALTQFELAAKDKSQGLAAMLWQGRCYKSLGDYQKATEVLKSAAQTADKSPLAEEIIYQQGLCERNLQHPQEARNFFEQVLARFPAGELADDSLHAMIEMSIESGNFPDAEKQLSRFQKDFPQSSLALHIEMLSGRLDLARAGAGLREKQPTSDLKVLYDSAAQKFEQVMEKSTKPKTKGQARYYLALTRQLQGDQAQSLELIAPVVEQAIADGAKSDFADAIVLQADSYYKQQKYDLAADSAAKYLDLFPKGRQIARALSIQALAAQNQKNAKLVSAALGRLTSEFANHPLTPTTVQQVAEVAESVEDWTTANQLYESLLSIEKDPERRAYAMRGLALAQYRQKKFAEAAETFGRIVGEFPKHSLVQECAYYQADSLNKADQMEKAISLFQKQFESFPGETPAAPKAELVPPLEYIYKAGLQIARILNRTSKVDEADAAYDALLKRFPQPADLDLLLHEWAVLNYFDGQSLTLDKEKQDKRYDRADAISRRLVEEVPQSPLVYEARLSLAESDLTAGKLEPAEKVFEELANNEKSPNEVKERSLYQLVVLAVFQQRWTDVRTAGTRLTTQFPESDYRYYVAYSQVEALLANPKPTDQELVAAREQLEQLKAEATNNKVNSTDWFDRVWVLMAELNFREKKYGEVVSIVEDLEQRDPKSPVLYQLLEVLGRTYKQQAKFNEARAAFARVLTDPVGSKTETAAKSQFLIGEIWFLQEKWDSALIAYQRVYSIYKFPEWQAASLLMSAGCDEKQDNWKLAVETYKQLIKEFPNSSVIEDAKTRLESAQKKAGG